MFVMAATSVPFQQNKKARKAAKRDSIELKADSTADSIVALMRDSIGRVIVDTTKMDSLQLAIYHHDLQPETIEEKLICYADKFFSKTHLEREKTIAQAEKSLAKFGGDTLARFREMKRLFEPDL